VTQEVADMLLRAAHARSIKSIAYGLGKGGRDPDAQSPADRDGRLDCSGLTCWLHRLDRRQVVDGDEVWLGTGGIIADAHCCAPGTGPCPQCENKLRLHRGKRRWYAEVDRPELGDLLVYASDKKGGRPYGHVGMVTGGLPSEWDPKVPSCWKALEVTDCHGPNGRRPGVTLVTGSGWGRHWGARNGTIIVRRVG
jgi:hypothetical protein